VRCPVNADDLARVVAQLAGRRDITGPLHVAGPEALDRASFARLIARSLGHDPSVLRTSTIAESGQLRPSHVVLDTTQATELGMGCRSVSEVLGV
jgi:dTDP-4-dehydrorhamnose reductase